MGAGEEGTLARLKALRREVANPKNKEHRGRIVKTTGDGLLLEFYTQMGSLEEAREAVKQIRDLSNVVVPTATHWRNAEHRELYLSGLRLAAGEAT